MGLFNKKELERIQELERLVSELQSENRELENTLGDLQTVQTLVENSKKELDQVNNEIHEGQNKIQEIQEQINETQNIQFLVDTNVYANPYTYENSKMYREELDKIKKEQKEWLQSCEAWEENGTWSLKDKPDLTTHASIILALRAFNNECDNIIMNVKYSNSSTCENKIRKSFKDINNIICSRLTGYFYSISEGYLELKLKELALKVGYETEKQEEKEEQQRIREIMKEEERVRKEIEDAKARVEKDEKHFNNEISKLEKKLAKEKGDKQELLDQIAKLRSKLEELDVVKQDVLNREMNTRAGYVYVISNIGSFGEDVYKIGVTRRLDPMIRVNELSSASVPFKFDVHAMIFTDDAFELETNLHRMFNEQRVNKVNGHKEFFAVSLDEIEKAVHEFNPTVEFTRIALAEEYRLSLNM